MSHRMISTYSQGSHVPTSPPAHYYPWTASGTTYAPVPAVAPVDPIMHWAQDIVRTTSPLSYLPETDIPTPPADISAQPALSSAERYAQEVRSRHHLATPPQWPGVWAQHPQVRISAIPFPQAPKPSPECDHRLGSIPALVPTSTAIIPSRDTPLTEHETEESSLISRSASSCSSQATIRPFHAARKGQESSVAAQPAGIPYALLHEASHEQGAKQDSTNQRTVVAPTVRAVPGYGILDIDSSDTATTLPSVSIDARSIRSSISLTKAHWQAKKSGTDGHPTSQNTSKPLKRQSPEPDVAPEPRLEQGHRPKPHFHIDLPGPMPLAVAREEFHTPLAYQEEDVVPPQQGQHQQTQQTQQSREHAMPHRLEAHQPAAPLSARQQAFLKAYAEVRLRQKLQRQLQQFLQEEQYEEAPRQHQPHSADEQRHGHAQHPVASHQQEQQRQQPAPGSGRALVGRAVPPAQHAPVPAGEKKLMARPPTPYHLPQEDPFALAEQQLGQEQYAPVSQHPPTPYHLPREDPFALAGQQLGQKQYAPVSQHLPTPYHLPREDPFDLAGQQFGQERYASVSQHAPTPYHLPKEDPLALAGQQLGQKHYAPVFQRPPTPYYPPREESSALAEQQLGEEQDAPIFQYPPHKNGVSASPQQPRHMMSPPIPEYDHRAGQAGKAMNELPARDLQDGAVPTHRAHASIEPRPQHQPQAQHVDDTQVRYLGRAIAPDEMIYDISPGTTEVIIDNEYFPVMDPRDRPKGKSRARLDWEAHATLHPSKKNGATISFRDPFEGAPRRPIVRAAKHWDWRALFRSRSQPNHPADRETKGQDKSGMPGPSERLPRMKPRASFEPEDQDVGFSWHRLLGETDSLDEPAPTPYRGRRDEDGWSDDDDMT